MRALSQKSFGALHLFLYAARTLSAQVRSFERLSPFPSTPARGANVALIFSGRAVRMFSEIRAGPLLKYRVPMVCSLSETHIGG